MSEPWTILSSAKRRGAVLAGAALAGVAVGLWAEPALLDRSSAPPAPPPAARATVDPGFLELRCRLLDHHQRQITAESARIAEEELAPIFAAMSQRTGAFADWAFRWRTSYSLFRRMALGGAVATLQGDLPFERMRAERDAMVDEALKSLLIGDADVELAAAARRWRDRVLAVVDEVERDHRTALRMYLGFDPPFAVVQPPLDLPGTEQMGEAGESARELITTRLVRPVLVRGTIRTGAVFLPPAVLPEVLVGGSLLPGATESVAALLGVDYLVSRIDAWAGRDAFAAEIDAEIARFHVAVRERWVALARRDVARRLDFWRMVQGELAGIGRACAPLSVEEAVREGATP